MKKSILFLITTFTGYFLGKWISVSLNTLFPIYFSIDPNFIQILFNSDEDTVDAIGDAVAILPPIVPTLLIWTDPYLFNTK